MEEGKVLFQKFETSAQEPVRLNLALQGYFSENTEEAYREKYEKYLKRRIRPALEALMKADRLVDLDKLVSAQWLDAGLLEDALQMAIRLKKSEIFVWLLGIKAEKYGFCDRDFSL